MIFIFFRDRMYEYWFVLKILMTRIIIRFLGGYRQMRKKEFVPPKKIQITLKSSDETIEVKKLKLN